MRVLVQAIVMDEKAREGGQRFETEPDPARRKVTMRLLDSADGRSLNMSLPAEEVDGVLQVGHAYEMILAPRKVEL